MQAVDLKQIEKKVYLTCFQDGIVDLMAGLTFILYGFVLIIGKPALLGLCFFPLLFIQSLKKRITVPRIGQVKFNQKRRHIISRFALTALIAGVLLLLLLLFFVRNAGFERYWHFFLGLAVGFVPLAGALLTHVDRYLLYAPLLSLTFILERFIPGSFPWSFFALGWFVMTVGLSCLIRFVRKYKTGDGE